jgi:hypothetical protein
MRRAFGIVLLLGALLAFTINFGVWHWFISLPIFSFFALLSPIVNLTLLWNPLSFFTPGIVGNIPFLSGAAGSILNYVWAAIWSFGLGIGGLVLATK